MMVVQIDIPWIPGLTLQRRFQVFNLDDVVSKKFVRLPVLAVRFPFSRFGDDIETNSIDKVGMKNKVDRPIEVVLGPKRRFQVLTMSFPRNTFLTADPSVRIPTSSFGKY
ncbi:hypothetical protein KIN20_002758 [Parelaphostrongylus tenuis]|uniref:Uncharacterized protein n=1 Tax=Parelaphostrongylus tenuis TaxID=148309 RepID=A0AAD5LVQ1_PARTN|nr:hypothetical protein KIN20_002758 [Parelaphostrongylus tenuis]